MSDLDLLKNEFADKLLKIKDISSLDKLRVEFIGKNGFLSNEMKKLGSMGPTERKSFGALVNSSRDFILSELDKKQKVLENQALESRLQKENIDVTIPGRAKPRGRSHPITHSIEEIKNIFFRMGFKFADGPEIEDDWHNFTGLNIPKMHPARQMHDTFYIESNKNLLLRTHTSSVQLRYMKDNKPPVRVISIGKVFRSDFDLTHTPMFHQIEGLCIDEEINLGHLKWCLSEFLRQYFGLREVPMRFRSSYFPFTEPSIEVDIKCDRSNKSEIKIGEGDDWMEILGCGMVNSAVLENMNVDSKKYQGFAFGVGVERLAMLKHNIPDLRSFFEGDLRWMDRYGF